MPERKSKKTLHRLDAFATARALDALVLPGYRHIISGDLAYRAVADALEARGMASAEADSRPVCGEGAGVLGCPPKTETSAQNASKGQF